MTFIVRLWDGDGWLEFANPRAVLRAAAPAGVPAALDAADAALRDGAWIAGVVPYERDGLALGVFDAPVRHAAAEPESFMLSPLMRTVAAHAYRDAIARIKAAIYDGDVYQVNYTIPFHIALEGDAFSAWQTVARRSGARYQAYVEDGTRRILSWSPELFLAFDGDRVTTRPMKGTSPPDDIAPLDDAKNRAEHVMIVDLLRNDLRQVCNDVRVAALCTIERYPTYATMTSTIEGRLRPASTLADIFHAAFPCGSITGAPKRAALEMIARLEPQSRGAYCGSIGYLSPQRQGWWNVAIRTAQFDGMRGRFDAGGGIVADSDADDEWREIRVKSRFLREDDGFRLWETFAGDADGETIEAHLARLAGAAALLDIACDIDRVRRAIEERKAARTLLRVRVALDGTFEILSEPLAVEAEVVDVCFSASRVTSTDPWLRIKSSWRPAQRAAWDEARQRGCFDALLRNERGELTEGSRTNLFVELEGALYTPPLECGLLPGVLRTRILAEGRASERVLHADDLERASAIYIGNSARGLLRARLQHQGAP